MKTTVSTKGQIILPAELRQQDGIEPGQEFDVERIDRGEYRLVRESLPQTQVWSTGSSPVQKGIFRRGRVGID
jgi:AbrB family looped-hinge helix DNA binding protein